jgi:SAM-dependent methyltransferase
MPQSIQDGPGGGSRVASDYSTGSYFADSHRHSEDAEFKSQSFSRLFLPFARRNRVAIRSYIDVGCGSGDVVRMVAGHLRGAGFDVSTVKGYDVSPHVRDLDTDGIQYVHGDFCSSDEFADLVTLFDVIEHVPDPVEFLKLASQRCRIMTLHIPLENSWNNTLRGKLRRKLSDSGHLIFMDSVSALNLLTLAGLRVVNYDYTFAFRAPSGRTSILSKVVFPFRYLLSKLSPHLMSKTLGGASLMVIALTPSGRTEGAH